MHVIVRGIRGAPRWQSTILVPLIVAVLPADSNIASKQGVPVALPLLPLDVPESSRAGPRQPPQERDAASRGAALAATHVAVMRREQRPRGASTAASLPHAFVESDPASARRRRAVFNVSAEEDPRGEDRADKTELDTARNLSVPIPRVSEQFIADGQGKGDAAKATTTSSMPDVNLHPTPEDLRNQEVASARVDLQNAKEERPDEDLSSSAWDPGVRRLHVDMRMPAGANQSTNTSVRKFHGKRDYLPSEDAWFVSAYDANPRSPIFQARVAKLLGDSAPRPVSSAELPPKTGNTADAGSGVAADSVSTSTESPWRNFDEILKERETDEIDQAAIAQAAFEVNEDATNRAFHDAYHDNPPLNSDTGGDEDTAVVVVFGITIMLCCCCCCSAAGGVAFFYSKAAAEKASAAPGGEAVEDASAHGHAASAAQQASSAGSVTAASDSDSEDESGPMTLRFGTT